LAGYFLVPGYGPFHGIKVDDLIREAVSAAPSLRTDWASPEVSHGDLRWLTEQGYSIM
jgi:hypothetical protein